MTVNPNANLVHIGTRVTADSGDAKGNDDAASLSGFAPVGAVTELISDAKNISTLQKKRAARQEHAMQE